ncbi:MAG: hybrid sensor histidine kinase/response regulator [Hyphomicrobium sp.]|nr:hybrid sensor histidine kinase/response regulator [Hyphomicrobium sp.]
MDRDPIGGYDPAGKQSTYLAELERRVAKLARINAALMDRVERSMERQATAFSLFNTAIALESQVRVRTDELKSALARLERANSELVAARDAAELANRFKTRFFTAVGHDLLQPLHAARLTLSAMSEAPAPAVRSGPDMPQPLAQQIDHALSTIEEMLRTILDLSKLEQGSIKPNRRPTALEDLFRGIVQDLKPIASARGLALDYRPSRVAVDSDPLMLRRILQNLVANAVNYTRRGRVLLASRRRGGSVRIEVWDTGLGIPPAESERIFEEFQRGSSSETSRVVGFGLGLSIVQRMSEALDHKVSLCSREGRGTCFSVTAPFAGASDDLAAQAGSQPSVSGFPALSVLVIENEPTIVAAMQALLARWGCIVETAANERELAEVLGARPAYKPDIVLADYHLGDGKNGLDLIVDLKSRFGARLPAILVSAVQTLAPHPLLQSGDVDLLRKPVKPAELRALMLHLAGPAR